MISDVRNCDRIIWDSTEVTGRIWERVRPYVEGYGIDKIANMPFVTGHGPVKRKETAKAVGLNERMRVLKYTGGEYFRGECFRVQPNKINVTTEELRPICKDIGG